MAPDDLGAAGSGIDKSFDRYARMVRRMIDVPVSMVSLVERDRQVFVGAEGLPDELERTRETPLTHSFCQYVVDDGAPVVLNDARLDERGRHNLAIPDMGVVAYAGYPIRDHSRRIIGALCALDFEPRDWQPEELSALEDAAASCSVEIAERGLRAEADRAALEAETLVNRSAVLLALSEGLSRASTLVEVASAVERVSVDHLDCVRAGVWLLDDGADHTPGTDHLRVGEPRTHALSYVPQIGDSWRSAQLNRELPADETNPLGAAVVTGAPVWFYDRAEQNESYPHLDLSAQIGEGRAFLPLTHFRRDLGAIALIWDEPRELTREDLTTVGALAAYAGQALSRALLLQEQADALVVLQTALLPRLPRTENLDLAARYRPAAARDQVGGDWYDAVEMSTGAVSLMIGDVVGHDIGAAATMGQMRTTLRALAWAVDDPPSRQVTRLEQAMDDLGVEGLATLVYATVEDDADESGARTLRWTNAGHPPPLLVTPDGHARWLEDDSSDLMLGVMPGAVRTDHAERLPRGSLGLLYTDGLVERRDAHLEHGLDRLLRSASEHVGLAPEPFLDAVLRDLQDGDLGDDVALLAVRVR